VGNLNGGCISVALSNICGGLLFYRRTVGSFQAVGQQVLGCSEEKFWCPGRGRVFISSYLTREGGCPDSKETVSYVAVFIGVTPKQRERKKAKDEKVTAKTK